MRDEKRKASQKTACDPLRYTEDFFAKLYEVTARISPSVAEDTFETSSHKL
jgi:hypothetical protein